MTANPEPMTASFGRQAQGSVMETDSHAVEAAIRKKFELQGRMGRICLEKGEVLISDLLDVSG